MPAISDTATISRAIQCSWIQTYRAATSFPRCKKASAVEETWGEKGTCYWRGRRWAGLGPEVRPSRWRSAPSGRCRCFHPTASCARPALRWGCEGKETEARRAHGTEKQGQDNRRSIFQVTHPGPRLGGMIGLTNSLFSGTSRQTPEPNQGASRSTTSIYILGPTWDPQSPPHCLSVLSA